MAANKNSCHQVWTEGEDRPRCSGHGETMYCQSNGHWRCAVKMRDYDHRAKKKRKADGFCCWCSKEPLYTEWYCSGCAKKTADRARAIKDGDTRKKRNKLLESCPITQNTVYSVSYGKLLNKLIKIGRLVEGGVGGEQESARQAYEGLYEKLGHELSTKPGGETWLQRQTTSAGMPNTLRATKSPLALASSLGG